MLILGILISIALVVNIFSANSLVGKLFGDARANRFRAMLRHRWQYVSIIIFMAVIIGNFIYQVGQPVSDKCGTTSFKAAYISDWDGSYGPCTYLQQVTDGLSLWLIYPLIFGFISFIASTIALTSFGIKHKWRKREYALNIISGITSCYIVIWLGVGVFMTILWIMGKFTH